MRKVRTAVIGVGYLGRFHAQKYAALPQSELVAVVDADAGNRDRVAAETGCRAVADYRDILGEVEAVSIATPTPLHFRHRPRLPRARPPCAGRKTHHHDARRSPQPGRPRCARWTRAAGGASRALQRRDPGARRHPGHATFRRVAPARTVQGARHGRQRRARPHDPRHRPDPEPGGFADHVDRCRRPFGVFGGTRHRQRADPVRQRLRGEHHREPRQHEDGTEAAHLPGRRLHFDRPAAEGPDDRAQAPGGRGRPEGPGRDRGAQLRAGRCAQVRDRGVPAARSSRALRRW